MYIIPLLFILVSEVVVVDGRRENYHIICSDQTNCRFGRTLKTVMFKSGFYKSKQKQYRLYHSLHLPETKSCLDTPYFFI
jgi:hypothetical protein